jgi:hypothetical protein
MASSRCRYRCAHCAPTVCAIPSFGRHRVPPQVRHHSTDPVQQVEPACVGT